MANVSMRQMLEAGVHFGHQARYWNPKMAPYIFGERNKIHIINLEKTLPLFNDAMNFVSGLAARKGTILFVGTKRAAQEAVREAASRCGMPFVDHRWLGGMLTNFKTIRSRIRRMERIEKMEESGEFALLPKKEVIKLRHEYEKLQKNLGGIRNMKELPGVIFIVDPRKERIAIAEARALNIPIVGIVDTNCDPDEIDYVIPGNDDAIRAVKLLASKIADAVLEAKQGEQLTDVAAAETQEAVAVEYEKSEGGSETENQEV